MCALVAFEGADRFRIQHSISMAALEKALLSGDDEYVQARCLEENGWPVDAGVVSSLLSLRGLFLQHHTRAVQAWVIETGLRFPAAVGQPIRFTTPARRFNVLGTVVAVIEGEAVAIVACPEGERSVNLRCLAENVIQLLQTAEIKVPRAPTLIRPTVGFEVLA